MEIEVPSHTQTAQLRSLWKEAFGDTDAYLDLFFTVAFSPDRCRCVTVDGAVAAALYWFDCQAEGRKIAYLYAVATARAHRGKGLCRKLMAHTHAHLKEQGYAGAILVPQEESLRHFYGGMGYRNAGGMEGFTCASGEEPVFLRAIGSEEFALRRRRLLPPGGVLQEGENLLLLLNTLQFYAGDGFLLAAWEEKGILHGVELLGNKRFAPGIVNALGCREGRFRRPGSAHPFAMYLPLIPDGFCPGYFGFAFD